MKKGSALFLAIIFATFLIVLGVIIYNVYISPSSTLLDRETSPTTQSQDDSSSNETANWKTINGQIKGWQDEKDFRFQMKVPQDFIDNGVEQEYSYNVTGENIKFFAGQMEGPGLLSDLFGRAGKSPLCQNPLDVVKINSGDFESCDLVQVNGQNTLFLISAYFGGGDGGGCSRYANLFVIKNVGYASSILFTVELEGIQKAIAPWMKYEKPSHTFDNDICPPEQEDDKIQTNLSAIAKNIRENQNLSEKDTQTMKTLYQILSTFKFLE